MAFYQQQDDRLPKSPAPLDYDLQSQKQLVAEATEEIKKELLEKWQQRYAGAQIFPDSLSSMNPALIDFLLAFNNTLFYNDLAKKFSLTQQQRDNLPKIVWYVCLNKKWEQLKVSLINDLSINTVATDQILGLLEQNIILHAKELAQQDFVAQRKIAGAQTADAQKQTLLSQPLNDALTKTPELGEQLITSEKITLRNFPEPVRPSIKNWLADYTFTIGYDNKDSIKRGNYIFHSQNALHLSPNDRQKLAYILKAHDDGSEITVNKNLKQIVFPVASPAPTAKPISATTPLPAAKPAPAPISRPQIPNPAYRPLSAQPPRAAAIPRPVAPNRPLPPTGPQNLTFQKPQTAAQPPARPASPQGPAVTPGNVSFSSAQKLPYEKIYPVKSDEVGATQFNRVNPVQSLPQQPPLEARANKIQSATPAQPAAQTKPHTAGPAPQQLPANQQPGDVKQSPYIIRPVFGNTEDTSSKKKPLPKNVVNLKDNFFQE